MKIDFVNETSVNIRKSDVSRWIEEELSCLNRKVDMEIEVLIVSPEKIRQLNNKHRHKDTVTDVLSFPLYNKVSTSSTINHLGSIVVCAGVAQKQADSHNHSFNKELEALVKHSVKHLLGIHHKE